MWKASHPPTPKDMANPRSRGPRFTIERNKEQGFVSPHVQEMNYENNPYGRSFRSYNAMEPPPAIGKEPRIASSIYSDWDSDNERRLTKPHVYLDRSSEYRDSQYTDASPPVSPMPGQYRNTTGNDSPDISPIEEFFEPAVQFPREKINFPDAVPVSQKFAKAPQMTKDDPNAGAILKGRRGFSGPHPARKTKWDEFSGEPTKSDRGKFAQVSPKNPHLPVLSHLKPSQKHPFGFFTRNKDTNQGHRRAPKLDPEDPALVPPTRPPWKGASGRSAILNPISTKKPSAEEPFIPPPRKDSRPQPVEPLHTTPAGLSTTSLKAPSDSVAPFRMDTFDFATSQSGIQEDTGYAADSMNGSNGQNPSTMLNSLPDFSHPLRSEARIRDVPFEPDYMKLESLDLEPQPVSRFSMTTFATTEVGTPPQSSRRSNEKDAPPLPDIPTDIAAKAARMTARKPTPSQLSAVTSKSLPRSPPEAEANNRIEAMEAKLRDLARRRGNINTIINELTQVIQPSSIAYDFATRAEVTKTVKSLNNELDDIKKDEHDIGLKLHRAYKKKDEEDEYEGSGLWIKRVTS
uniref:BHLH domain-containing protein n=1 Tax=Coccidioides posadasii RMSCC 3488 TaxID=454284 RepID=A0A0J6FUU5_COCPO|nr:hypothetical protein CPAG_09219 [Coccidioides posadasii RMSCC 3488]